MKLKIDEAGHAVIANGKPVYVHDDGKEVEFDAPAAFAKIGSLNAENKAHREAKEELEAKVRSYAGIGDPEKAMQALATVKNLEAKTLIDAGEVEKVVNDRVHAAVKQFVDEKHLPIVNERDAFAGALRDEKMSNAFARSKYVLEKMEIPSDVAQSHFGRQFKVENNRIVGYDVSGNVIYSRSKPGEVAEFDEALESMVDAYPFRDRILKGSGASGGGASTSKSLGNGQDLSKLPPIERMNIARGAQRK